MMYDFASKELLNPETHRERVNEFLPLLLGQPVKILEVLPNDGTRLADESTLLITDIVVELSDSSIVNLEIQKIGYDFPGQRSACYSADLLLRQYKRVQQKNSLKDSHAKVHYKDIKNVYTIVLFEKSPKSFYKYPNVFPDFKECYEQVYEICRNIEEVMSMFSKELAELDRNTTEFMIDRMQKEIDQQAEKLKEKDRIIAELQATNESLKKRKI